tara:strand:+ start:583 stop:696 length:114 start_codon:yes stop_codon:yes gene_type:complete
MTEEEYAFFLAYGVKDEDELLHQTYCDQLRWSHLGEV